ncbi:hypothetical protein JOM56_011481, partial [Amanita muscaria]
MTYRERTYYCPHVSDEISIEVITIQASHIPHPIASRGYAFVEIIAGNDSRRTERIKLKKNASTRWDAHFVLPLMNGASNITFSVFHDSLFHDKCLGRVEISVRALLERQRHRADEDVILSLANKKGKLGTGRLAIRILEQPRMSATTSTTRVEDQSIQVAEQSTTSAISRAVEQAQTSEQQLSPPRLAKMADAVTSLANTASNQTDLVISFDCLLDKVAILVKIGDGVAKIHPYVNFAWQVLSAGVKIVKAQQVRDQKISDLVRTMENLYSFVALTDELAENRVLQDIVEQILKQTIECGFFIQEYSRRNFGGRAIVQLFSDADDRITEFCAAFARLRGNFDSRVNLNTALVLSRTASTIDAIRRDQVLSALKRVAINAHNRDPCLPKTRLDVVEFLVEWIADRPSNQNRVLWLYGLAGSGKSTLSTTIAWMMRELHRLGAFFFFDRDIPERNAATMIPVLAYQLAQFDARIGAIVSQIVESNQNIAEMPVNIQFTTLLKPLQSVEWSGGPIVLVIDALDECGIEKDRAKLLDALSIGFSDLPPFIRVIIASRPETDIQRTFASHPAVYSYHLDIDSAANKGDISEFLRHRLNKIRTNNKYLHLASDWPGDDKINALTECAAGLFVWASTACLYIDSHAPDLQLNELIMQQSVDTSSEPFANLDRLYKTGLQSAGRWTDTRFCSDCCAIFGAIICARNPLTCSMMDSLLSLKKPCLQSISRLGCVLRWSETEPIRILHPSFHDYLSGRCHGESWFIDLEQHNAKLAVHCIKLLDSDDGLRENICGLTLPHPVQNETLPEAVSYACKFWVEHICLISKAENGIGDLIHEFLGRHLLHWIEALAILKRHDITIRSLQSLLKWLSVSLPGHNDLRQLVYDAHRFAQYFSNTIEEHPLLIYVSALPFTPANTSIYQRFYCKRLLKVISDALKSWPPQLQLFRGHEDSVTSVAFSYNGSKIVSGSYDKTVRVWDANTGVEMLPPLQGH